ncbi:DUF6541 family protein [Schaalia georgiae]|nr:DUF6541 family protein [Schaalia georgiae]
MIGQWWFLAPTFALMLVALVLPGVFWTRAGTRSALVAVGAAPAFTFGVVTVLSVLYSRASIRWEAATVLPVLGMCALLGALTWFGLHVRRASGGAWRPGMPLAEAIGTRVPLGAVQRAVRGATWGAVALGFALAALPMLAGADPADPVQQWDSTFHMNGVHAILLGGDASPFGGLHELYGGREVYYPTGWHAFVALFATPQTVVPASNVSSLALMAVWVTGAAALVSVLTSSRTAVLAAPVVAGLMPNMPADALTMYNQWPNATGTALLPGLMGLAVLVGRRFADDWRSRPPGRALARRAGQTVFLMVGALGLIGAHPSAVFSLLALLAAPLMAALVGLARSCDWQGVRGRAAGIAWSLVAAAVVVVPLVVLASPKIRAMGKYPRQGVSWSEGLAHMFVPFPPFAQTMGMTWWTIVQFVFLVAGLVVVAGLARLAVPGREDTVPASPGGGRMPVWPFASYLVAGCLTALAYSPSSQLRMFLLAPWYMDSRRIMGLQSLMVSVLIAVGFAWIAELARGAVARFSSQAADSGADQDGRALAEGRPSASAAPQGGAPAGLPAPAPDSAPAVGGAPTGLPASTLAGADQDGDGSADEDEEAALLAGLPRWTVAAVLAVAALVVSGFGAFDARAWAVDYVYDSDHLGKPGMATTGELAMLRRMRSTTPEDALVVGDPIAGEAYVELLGGRKAVFPQLSAVNQDGDSQNVLTKHFNEIHTNPQVCEVVRKLGITHYYQEQDGQYYNFARSSRFPGLYNVDTSTGFELIDRGDAAVLYRITACGDVAPGGGPDAFK